MYTMAELRRRRARVSDGGKSPLGDCPATGGRTEMTLTITCPVCGEVMFDAPSDAKGVGFSLRELRGRTVFAGA